MFINLNQVLLKSHAGDIEGSSDAIKINVTQKINLLSVKIHKEIPLSINIIGVYLPKVSKKLKIKINNVVNTGYDISLYKILPRFCCKCHM